MLDKENEDRRIKKTFFTLFTIFLGLIILVYSLSNTISKKRVIPSLDTKKLDLAIRGDVLSADEFKIARSKKIFTASIDTRSLDLDKLDLFVTLFSIYSEIDKKEIENTIKKSLKKRKGFLILSRKISSRSAKNLKLLAYKLKRLKVFKRVKINGSRRLFGLDLYETGEQRLYPYKDTLSPVIGYIKKLNNKNNKLRVKGEKGLENFYDHELNNISNGILQGERDISSYVIFNKNSKIITTQNGQTLQLNIPLKLQKNIEIILDKYKEKLGAKEIIVSVMKSTTGEVLSFASSNRFNPSNIQQKDIPNLNVNAIEQTFEPGSVIKPILISLAIDKNRVNETELLSAYNFSKKNKKGLYKKGKIKIDRWTIKDDHQFSKNYLTLKDIIIFSSNIGTLQIAQRLSGQEILDGYKNFGFLQKTGIDLPYEKIGKMPSIYQLRAGEDKNKDNVFKATVSYGQGMRTTFIQLLRAYSVFNNEGKIVTPSIVHKTMKNYAVEVISKQSANTIKKYLIKTVQEGTGKNTIIEGLQIGGKTGTANKARGGQYKKKYMSSFFGFANDTNEKYTIGVSVNEPISTGKYWYYYYASNSAVPVFKEIVQTLVKLNYLTPTQLDE
jgi:cell division protein FtsI (penicillin-binding protein 3)